MPITRLSFIRMAIPAALYSCISRKVAVTIEPGSFIMSVNGPVGTNVMGFTLTHEHLFSIFGQEAEEKTTYHLEELLSSVLPFLQEAKAAGCQTIIDCTAMYFGRNVQILKTLSEKSGMTIVTNTGIYGAANGKYIPAYAYTETSEQIASRWITEWKNGIDKTGIRPGFIKLGINSGALAAIDKKLLQAGAITHLATGLTIAVHTTDNAEAAFEQLAILREYGVSPSAWIWTHAHVLTKNEPLLEAAEKGAWISFDGYQPQKHERFVQGVNALKEAGYLHRVLLSHDANSYPQKGKMPSRSSLALVTHFLPAMPAYGFTQSDIHQLTVLNPSKAFEVTIRKI